MTTSTTATTFEQAAGLLAAAQTGNPGLFLDKLMQYREGICTPDTGAALVAWVSTPANLTQLHAALTERMGIPQRALAIKRRNVTRGQQVMMLLQAMETAVRRAHNL